MCVKEKRRFTCCIMWLCQYPHICNFINWKIIYYYYYYYCLLYIVFLNTLTVIICLQLKCDACYTAPLLDFYWNVCLTKNYRRHPINEVMRQCKVPHEYQCSLCVYGYTHKWLYSAASLLFPGPVCSHTVMLFTGSNSERCCSGVVRWQTNDPYVDFAASRYIHVDVCNPWSSSPGPLLSKNEVNLAKLK